VDIGLDTTTVQTEDKSWLATARPHEQVSGTIDPTDVLWVEADHYPNGFIPSGVAVAYDVATDTYVPYDDGGAGDTVNFAGFLYNSTPVTAAIAASRMVAAPILVFGFVSLDALPSAGGMTNGGLGAVRATAIANVAAAAPTTTMIYIGA
jgi:hypothetical protein